MQILKKQIRRIIFPLFASLFFIGLAPGIANAQEKLSFQEIDRLTLEAFNQGDWTEVVRVANLGYSLGIDYFYLRLRSGIALYNMERYERAIRDFTKALGFSEDHSLTLEYLYYALKGAGRTGEASRLVRRMPLSLKDRMMSVDRRFLATAEGGAMFAGNKDEMLGFHPDNELSHHYFIRAYQYGALLVHAKANPVVAFDLGYQSINFLASQQFFVEGLDPIEFGLPFREHGGYLALHANLPKGFSVHTAGKFLYAGYELMSWDENLLGGQYVRNGYNYTDFATHASLRKRFPFLDMGFLFDMSRIRNEWYRQTGFDATLYPLGNLDLFIRFQGTLHSTLSSDDRNWILQGAGGFRFLPAWWIEVETGHGRIQNWSENLAHVVYNNLDPLLNRWAVSLQGYQIATHLDLSIRFQRSVRISSWQIYSGSQITGTAEKEYPFYSLTGTLRWHF